MHYLFLLLALLGCIFNTYAQDLVITNIQCNATQTQYQIFHAKVTVKNQGTLPVSQFNVTDLFLSKDTILDNTDAYFCFSSFRELGVGESIVLDVSGTANQFGINASAGEYYLFAKADVRKEVEEINENNNTFRTKLTVLPAQVDLTFSNVRVDNVIASLGSQIQVSYTIRNLGTHNISSIYSSFYLSQDEQIDATDLTWNYQYNGLQWQSSKSVTQQLTVPFSGKPGVYYLYGRIDNYGQELTIDETNIANNTVFVSKITISGPHIDLQLNSLSVSASHEIAFIDYSVSNLGTTGASYSEVAIYFSKDTILDPTDVRRGNIRINFIEPQQTKTAYDNIYAFRAYEYFPAGEWYAIGKINPDNAIPESNYANNRPVVSRKFTIADYEFYLRIDSLTFSDPIKAGTMHIPIRTTLLSENFAEYTDLTLQLFKKDQTLVHKWEESFLSIHDGKNSYSKVFELPSALEPGEYSLVLTSDPFYGKPDASSKTHTFTVAPIPLVVEAKIIPIQQLLLKWKPETYITEAAYAIRIFDNKQEALLDTIVTTDSLLLSINRFKPNSDYTMEVVYEKDKKQWGKGTAPFHIEDYQTLLVITRAEQTKSVGLLDEYVPIRLELMAKNHNEMHVLTYEILDSLNRTVMLVTDSVFIGISPGGRVQADTIYSPSNTQVIFTKSLSIRALQAPGAYKIRISSSYIKAMTIPFMVDALSILLQEVDYQSEVTLFKWDTKNAIENVQYTVRVFSADSDTLISTAGQKQLTLPNSFFQLNKPYFWSVNGALQGKATTSAVSPLTPFVVLGNEEEYSKIIIYPNPSSGTLYLNTNKDNYSHVQVWSLSGKLVHSFVLEKNTLKSQIFAENLPRGTYVIRLTNHKKTLSYKVWVE